MCCEQVANQPEPRMLQDIAGILRLASRAITELSEGKTGQA
jgi:hypothetical protein